MALKYLDAGRSVLPTKPKDIWIDAFQARMDDQFYNSSDWWTIQEETYFSSGVFEDVDVRVNEVVSNETGSTPSDDFKLIMFKNLDHPTSLGWLYYFDDNFWIVINTERTKTLTSTATVKRCNNMLRWIDSDGGKYSVPFTMADYLIRENRNYSTAGSALVNPSGIIEIATQFNDKTNKIRPNQRFLLGNPNNWTAYRVQGGGINNLNLLKTTDNMSAGLMKLTLAVDYANDDNDDLVNGYADVLQDVYVVLVENGYSITGNISETQQLNVYATLNGVYVSRSFEYLSSDETVVTVSSTGLLSFISAGTAIVRVNLLNNDGVYKDISVTVSAVPVTEYRISITPDKNYILQGESCTFTTKLLQNSSETATTFTFSVNSNSVPVSGYYYFNDVDGNNFTITNLKMFLADTVDITADDGNGHSQTFKYQLRGGW